METNKQTDEKGVTRTFVTMFGDSPQLHQYQSTGVDWNLPSDADPEKCEALIGKTVAHIDAGDYDFTLTFTDGSTLTLDGHRWEDDTLGVGIKLKEP